MVQVLMGEGLRSVIMHEMGHILGLRLQRFEMRRLQTSAIFCKREMFGYTDYTVLLQKCGGDCFFLNPVYVLSSCRFLQKKQTALGKNVKGKP